MASMQVKVLPGCEEITVRTPIGVLYNVICAGLLGSASSILFAAAGLTDISVGYFLGIFYGCLGGVLFARFSLKDREQRAVYHETFEYILKHLPSRQASKSRFLKAFFWGPVWCALLITVQFGFPNLDRLSAAMNAVVHVKAAAADSTQMQRYVLLSDSFLTHAPPSLL